MYTVSKGPSKFVAKTRMGIPAHLESSSWEIKKSLEMCSNEAESTNYVLDIPKPVFLQINNKKLNSMRSQEALTPEHEEIVKYVSENWSSVTCKSKDQSSSVRNGCSTVYYSATEPNNQLNDFVPFDLDSWLCKRIFNTITKSVP